MYCKLICILYALLCGQNFILVKSGCYNLPDFRFDLQLNRSTFTGGNRGENPSRQRLRRARPPTRLHWDNGDDVGRCGHSLERSARLAR
jgi:hypothetical protein